MPRKGTRARRGNRDGIRREVKKETNLEIELLTPLIPFDRIVKINEEISLYVIYIDYVAKLVGGGLKTSSDIGEALWIEKENTSKDMAGVTRRYPEVAQDS